MTSPSRAPLHRERPPRRISEKKLAERKANGEQFVGSTIAKRGGRPRPKNPKRAAKNHARAYGEHADYIRSLPCIACGYVGATEAAHSASGGMGRKAGSETLVPLCGPHRVITPGIGSKLVEGCHRELHRVGIKTFEARYGLSLSFHASRLFSEGPSLRPHPEGRR